MTRSDVRIAELRGEHHQQRPEPLAACVDQVPGGFADELDVGRDRERKLLLDLQQLGTHACFQRRIDLTRSE